MKNRIIALFLALVALALTACGGRSLVETTPGAGTETAETTAAETDARQVPSPMQPPVYTFDHEPTIDEMRAMAVTAMHDILTVQWFPEKTVRYNKSGAVSEKDFELLEERYYMGLPYTSAGTGLFQFLAYYDSTTGCMSYTNQATFNEAVGTSCAGAPAWALSTVCTSIRGNCVSNLLTISNGFYPLGGVDYDPAITDFAEYFTKQIVKENGDAKVLAGYAATQPGDLVVYGDNSEGRGHTRMVIEKPQVVYKDGAIDPDNSSVVVQEQAASDINDDSSGITMIRCGELSKKYTFRSLLNEGYIAVTTAEFLGRKGYEKCQVSYEGGTDTVEDLDAGTVRCNYPMAVLRVILHTDDGDTTLRQVLFNRQKIGDGTAREYAIGSASSTLARDRRIPKSGSYSVSLEITAATGEIFTPVTVNVNG